MTDQIPTYPHPASQPGRAWPSDHQIIMFGEDATAAAVTHAKPSIEEVTRSLTGYDELAIQKHFKADWTALAETSPVAVTRALVFVMERRRGLTDQDAYKAAMGLTIGECTARFADTDEQDDEGKGE
jgi:hypothetical protein